MGTAPDRVLSSFILAGLRALPTSIPVSRSLVKMRKRSIYLCFRSFILHEILATLGDSLKTGLYHVALIQNPLHCWCPVQLDQLDQDWYSELLKATDLLRRADRMSDLAIIIQRVFDETDTGESSGM